eukprot:6176298-Pleurochrysis_carterae.AAC.1
MLGDAEAWGCSGFSMYSVHAARSRSYGVLMQVAGKISPTIPDYSKVPRDWFPTAPAEGHVSFLPSLLHLGCISSMHGFVLEGPLLMSFHAYTPYQSCLRQVCLKLGAAYCLVKLCPHIAAMHKMLSSHIDGQERQAGFTAVDAHIPQSVLICKCGIATPDAEV